MPKRRLDQALVAAGLAPSTEKAKALILSGVVLVNDTPAPKAGSLIAADATLRLKTSGRADWVSRGALKLQPALSEFSVDPSGRRALDVGASTGGFTEVLLRAGALQVYAVDVGYNQLAWKLRQDPRVVVLERTNARHLEASMFPEPPTICTIDVSFISTRIILPAIQGVLGSSADILVMVKPQFEVAKERVGKGGVVRNEAHRREAIDGVADFAATYGWAECGRRDNDIRGPKGNLETFLHLRRGEKAAAGPDAASA